MEQCEVEESKLQEIRPVLGVCDGLWLGSSFVFVQSWIKAACDSELGRLLGYFLSLTQLS